MRRSVLLPFATAECFLPPGPMASDRHAAIARPLYYASTMATGVRALLTADSHVCGFLSASVHTADSFRLPSVVLMPSITCVCVSIPSSWLAPAPAEASAAWLSSLSWASMSFCPLWSSSPLTYSHTSPFKGCTLLKDGGKPSPLVHPISLHLLRHDHLHVLTAQL